MQIEGFSDCGECENFANRSIHSTLILPQDNIPLKAGTIILACPMIFSLGPTLPRPALLAYALYTLTIDLPASLARPAFLGGPAHVYQ